MVSSPQRSDSAPTPIDARRGLSTGQDAAQRSPAKTWRVWGMIGLEAVLAIALIAAQAPLLQGAIIAFMLLLLLDIVAEMNPIDIYDQTNVSVGFVILMAIVIHFGVPGAVIVGPLEAIVPALIRRRVTTSTLHNACTFTITSAAIAVVYSSLAPVGPTEFTASMVPAVLLATLTGFALYAFFAGTFLSLHEGEPVREFWSKHSWLAPHYFAFGMVGLALAMAYTALGIVGILAFVAPALMLRVAMVQYVAKTRDNVEKLEEQNTQLRRANIEIVRMSDELRDSYDSTLEALVNALDARDQETKGHSLRVSRYMMEIAREMGVPEGTREWIDMQRGSLLHDVGKIGVSDSILLKPGKLTEDEWEWMRKHPEIGYNMLRQVKFLEGAAEIILAHHERWDGKGYPYGLHEYEIPLGARIFTVVDTFDSMTSDRPYRKALSTLEAMNEILRCRDSQFDPRVVEAFMDIYPRWVEEQKELHAEEEERRRAA